MGSYEAAFAENLRRLRKAAGSSDGMISMDQAIFAAWQAGRITRQTALDYADNPDQMLRRLG